MYFNGTKCQLLFLSCFLSASLFAKDVKTLNAQGLQKPMTFIENKGQVLDENDRSRNDIQFKLATKGMNLYVGDGKLHYQFKKVVATEANPDISTYQMNVALLGANPHAKVTVADKQAYYENYFLSNTSTKALTAHAYNKIIYSDVYPNIDWVLYIKDDNVEYDFVVHPGGNPADIKIKYDGATSLSITKDGSILATTPMGEVMEKHPVAFETATRKSVASKFVLHDQVISFETGSYKGALTIDPFLNWNTYIGGSNEDRVTSVKCGAGGETYACGYTVSTDLPVSGGPYQASSGGGTTDAFLARYSSGGTIVFTTYFGGTGNDEAFALATSNAGTRIYMVGNTTSNGLASGGAYHTTNNGSTDMFVIRINNTGTTRSWSSYIGGTGTESGNAITCDVAGNVYVGGSTTSSTASTIVAGTPYQGSFGGGTTDGYLAKFNSTGGIQWATYYGGSAEDEINAITSGGSSGTASIAVTGTTRSRTAMASTGAAQGAFGGGLSTATDAFVASFNSASSNRSWGTYLGASGVELGLGIDYDTLTNDVYVTGNTTSTDSIAFGLAYQRTFGGTQDAYLVKYNSSGALRWGTFLGGGNLEYCQSVTVDPYRNVVIAGESYSTSGLATSLAYQTTAGGAGDAFIGKFNQFGQNIYTSYFGAGGIDYANGVTTDPNNSAIIIGGYTLSKTGFSYASSGVPAQTNIGGGTTTTFHDGFVARFRQDTLVWIRQPFTDTIVCPGGTLIVHDTTIFSFQPGNTFTVEMSDASGSFASPTTIGTSTATTAGNITCSIPASTPLGTSYRIRVVSSNPYYISPDNIMNIAMVNPLPAQTVSGSTPVCVGQPIRLFDSAPYEITGYSWTGPAGSGYTSTSQNPVIPGSSVTTAFDGVYTITTTHNGCPAVSNTFSVTVNSYHPPAPTVTATTPICGGSTLALTASSGMAGTFTYYWTGPGGFTSTLQNPTRASISIATGAGTYTVRDTLGGCESAPTSVTVSVLPNATPAITISVTPNDTVCIGTLVHFTASTTLAGFSPTFQWYSGATTLITGAVLDYYNTSTWPLGTDIHCQMVSSVACPVTPYASSNVIRMKIINNTPVINLTATPDTFIAPGGSVTFHTTIAGSLFDVRTWYVNNVPYIDTYATGTLTLNHITSNDTVRYEVTSNASCANIGASNTIVIHVTTGVANVSPEFAGIELFPNPNAGSFAVKGALLGIDEGDVDMQVTNVLGQVIYNGTTRIQNGQIDNAITLGNVASGMYMLRINKDGSGKVFRFMVN